MALFSVLSILLFACLEQSATGAPAATDPTLNTGANITYPLPTQLIYQFPNGTWIENLAIRPNGHILATEDTKPRLYELDPFSKHPANIVAELNDTASVLGIAEGAPDIFYICTGNYSSKLLQGYGEAFVYQVDMTQYSPHIANSARISKIAMFSTAGALNGLAYLPASKSLLISDFLVGVIWRVDVASGDIDVAINNTYTHSSGFAVNGLRLHNSDLYFTNSGQGTLVRVPINARGDPVGDFKVLAQGGFTPDDMAVDARGDAYVVSFTVGKNGLVFVPREGGNGTYIAGMAGPTAAAFGKTERDRDVLYVTTSGGDYSYLAGEGDTVAGQILAVKVGRKGY
ncbi:MAG: hypothetical protein M1821_007511 [Bathelium mastoideum]|nr:MAG: hypothetical protein M1821_007511 [Bathelium mastoideum]KAI9695014.1 MAG: hypothetical protein M1822_000631 [Bathelium mastoideum]